MQRAATSQGFRILSVPNPTNWKAVPLDEHFTLEHRPRGVPLVGIAGDSGTVLKLQYHEGIVEYDHVPTEKSLYDFYASDWMGETIEQATAKVEAVAAANGVGAGGVRWELIKDLRVESAMDVGAGYGDQMANLHFVAKQVHLIEPCTARGVALVDTHGGHVARGSFPQVGPPDGCKIDLIVCHHVIEHVRDAEQVFAAFADCQSEGGRLVITCPEFIGEPKMGVCLFWPHLRSFTRHGLATTAARFGYEIERCLSDEWNIAMRFVRLSSPLEPPPLIWNRDELFSDFTRGLGLGGPRLLHWERDYSGAAHVGKRFAAMQQKYGGIGRCVEIDDISQPKTDCPIEIQWQGPTRVFVK